MGAKDVKELGITVGFGDTDGELVGGLTVGWDEIVGLKVGADDGDEDGTCVILIAPTTIFSAAIAAAAVVTA